MNCGWRIIKSVDRNNDNVGIIKESTGISTDINIVANRVEGRVGAFTGGGLEAWVMIVRVVDGLDRY